MVVLVSGVWIYNIMLNYAQLPTYPHNSLQELQQFLDVAPRIESLAFLSARSEHEGESVKGEWAQCKRALCVCEKEGRERKNVCAPKRSSMQ